MKQSFRKLAIAACSLVTVTATALETQAANVRLDGYGYYDVRSSDVFSRGGKEQSGRYHNLGRDYYHKVKYGIDFISNYSGSYSGSLSYEFWAMPYYGATSGIILMTRGVSRMLPNESYEEVFRTGYAVSLDKRRFPEQSLWELTRNGWKFRDALSFTHKGYL